jgi:hypothetical protein
MLFSVIVRAVLRTIGVGSRISIAVSVLLLLRIDCRRESHERERKKKKQHKTSPCHYTRSFVIN